MIFRTHLLRAGLAASLVFMCKIAGAEDRLELLRVLEKDGCTLGELYYNGDLIAHTLEKPWKQNKAYVSSIPAGTYGAFIRFKPGKKDWWRVQFTGTEPRSGIQIHIGNVPSHTKGCVLVGDAAVYSECRLKRSTLAYDRIRSSFYDLPRIDVTPHPDLIDDETTGKKISVGIKYAPRAMKYSNSTGFYFVYQDNGVWRSYFHRDNQPTGSIYREKTRTASHIITEAESGPHEGQWVRWEIEGGRIERSPNKQDWHLIDLAFRRVN